MITFLTEWKSLSLSIVFTIVLNNLLNISKVFWIISNLPLFYSIMMYIQQ